MKQSFAWPVAALCMLLQFLILHNARAQATFSNTAPITINAVGAAVQYPSTIHVSGLSDKVATVSITLTGITHPYQSDIIVALVSPAGEAMLLMHCGQAGSLVNDWLTFSDDAPAHLPAYGDFTTVGSGVYKPTNTSGGTYEALFHTPTNFPAPGPGTTFANPGPDFGGTATLAGTFMGTEPNGDWKLYVADVMAPDGGSIDYGWSISITTARDTSFWNTAPITINPSGAATPYPSLINISGLSGTVADASVMLNSISHPYLSDVIAALASPSGETMLLMHCGLAGYLINETLIFSDHAPAHLPAYGDFASVVSGMYKPTNTSGGTYELLYHTPTDFPAPGPGTAFANPGPDFGGTATLFNTFKGINPNGAWKLYVADVMAPDGGSIAYGWAITLTVTNSGVSLPVSLSSFTGRAAGPANVLDWMTQSETHNLYFAVERSYDGKDFTEIGKVMSKAPGAVAAAAQQYSFTDEAPGTGAAYYRLRQTDADGSSSLSNTVAIIRNEQPAIPLARMIGNSRLEVSLPGNAADYSLQLTDMNGKIIASVSAAASGLSPVVMDMAPYAAGMYVLQVNKGAAPVLTQKISKQ